MIQAFMQPRISFLNLLCLKPWQLRRSGRFIVRRRWKNTGGPLKQQIIRWHRKFLWVNWQQYWGTAKFWVLIKTITLQTHYQLCCK